MSVDGSDVRIGGFQLKLCLEEIPATFLSWIGLVHGSSPSFECSTRSPPSSFLIADLSHVCGDFVRGIDVKNSASSASVFRSVEGLTLILRRVHLCLFFVVLHVLDG